MSDTSKHLAARSVGAPWNKGTLVGQKQPLKLQEIWAIRIRLGFLEGENLLQMSQVFFATQTSFSRQMARCFTDAGWVVLRAAGA